MTRVVLAGYDDTPPLGGQGVMLEGVRDELQRRGVHVDTISGRGDNAVGYPRVTGRAPLDLSLHLNRRPQLLLRSRPEVVHASGGPGGVMLLRELPVPVVYTANHTYTQAHQRPSPRRWLAPLEARSYQRAAAVLAVSRSTADAVLAMGVPAERVEVLPPGVRVPEPETDGHDPERLLFVGRLEPGKGVLDAVTVMRLLLRERSGARAVIVGDGSLAAAVRKRVAGEPRIRVSGAIDARAVQREFARATLLLMPSRYEGLGLAALEAQAAGTPVVGYDVDGLRHAATDGGELVTVGHVDRLLAATRRLLEDAARRAELARLGREFVRREHSWERYGERLLEVYAAVSSGAGR